MTNTAKKRSVKSLEVSDNFLLYTSREKAADYRLFSQRTKQRQHLWLATVIAAIYTDYKNSIAVYKDNYQLLAEKFSPLQSEYIRNLPDTFGKKQQYIDLLLDENYEDVQYNPNNGGLKARHKNRGKYDSKGRKLELELMDYLYGLGHTVILLEDKEEKKGEPLSSLDMNLDGEPMDIRSKTKKLQSNTIKNDLSEKKQATQEIQCED